MRQSKLFTVLGPDVDGGITIWNFYLRLFPGSMKAPPAIEFQEHLLRQIEGKLIVV